MPLVKIPAIKAPSVSLYIRITDEKGRRRYERVRPRSPQPCGPRDNYALLYYVPKMTWEQVGQDYNEAVRRRAAKEHELLQEKREQSTQPDTTPKAPSSLEELRSAFLAMKRKERKRDRTPLDERDALAFELFLKTGPREVQFKVGALREDSRNSPNPPPSPSLLVRSLQGEDFGEPDIRCTRASTRAVRIPVSREKHSGR
jgi:hypothetical protein